MPFPDAEYADQRPLQIGPSNIGTSILERDGAIVGGRERRKYERHRKNLEEVQLELDADPRMVNNLDLKVEILAARLDAIRRETVAQPEDIQNAYIAAVARAEDLVTAWISSSAEFRRILDVDGISGKELVEATLPCLITVEKDNFYGRLPNLKAYLDSKTAEITTYTENNIDGLDPEKIGVPGSGTIVPKIYPPELPEPGQIIRTGSPKTDVSELLKLLAEKDAI